MAIRGFGNNKPLYGVQPKVTTNKTPSKSESGKPAAEQSKAPQAGTNTYKLNPEQWRNTVQINNGLVLKNGSGSKPTASTMGSGFEYTFVGEKTYGGMYTESMKHPGQIVKGYVNGCEVYFKDGKDLSYWG